MKYVNKDNFGKKAIVFGIIMLFMGASSSVVLSVNVADLDSNIINIVSGGGDQPPVANFTWSPSNPMVNESITFNASNSYDSDGYITNWSWDFENDGTEDAWGKVVTHAYSDAGMYEVKLRVQDNDSISSNCTNDVIVLEKTFIVGLIENKIPEGDFIYLSGKLLYVDISGSGSGVEFLFSGEEVIISKDYLGYIGPCNLTIHLEYTGPYLIVGFFKACIV